MQYCVYGKETANNNKNISLFDITPTKNIYDTIQNSAVVQLATKTDSLQNCILSISSLQQHRWKHVHMARTSSCLLRDCQQPPRNASYIVPVCFASALYYYSIWHTSEEARKSALHIHIEPCYYSTVSPLVRFQLLFQQTWSLSKICWENNHRRYF